MSTTETILAAVASALAGVADGHVYRSRREQLETLPAVIVLPESADGAEDVIGVEDGTLVVAVEVYAKGDTPDTAADATLSAIWSALCAAPNLGLGSDVDLIRRRRVDWDFEDYDHVRATLHVSYLYRTATGAM